MINRKAACLSASFLILLFIFLPSFGFGQDEGASGEKIIDESPIAIKIDFIAKPMKTGETGSLSITLIPEWDFKDIILDITAAGVMRAGDSKEKQILPLGKSLLPKMTVNDHRQIIIPVLKANSSHEEPLILIPQKNGYGYIVVKVLDKNNKPIEYSPTIVLYFLSLDDKVFTSTHSLQDLDLQKLEKELLDKGKSKEEIQRELKKIKQGGAIIEKKLKAGIRKDASSGAAGPYNSITVEGTIRFTDANNGTHPVRFATVQILDQEAAPAADQVVTTTQTDAAGFYTVTIDDNDGDGTGRDIYVVVQANGDTVQVEDSATGDVWELNSLPALANVVDNTTQTVNITATNNNGSPQNVAFEAYEAVNYLSRYLPVLGEPFPGKVDLRYPCGSSYFSPTSVFICIAGTDVHEWDVVQHEYCHYLQDIYNTSDSPGGAHSSCNNDCTARNSKDIGTRLAWGESWPTFFSIMVQREQNVSTLGIPNAGDVSYLTWYSLENENDGCNNGEGCERALMRIFWDLYDNANDDQDQGVALGAQVMWDLIADNQPHTFSEFWNVLIFGRTEAMKAAFGRICARYGVAVQMTSPADNQAYNGGAAPTFQWNAPANCDGVNTQYMIKFFNNDFTSLIGTTPWQTATSFTPSNDQLNQIFVGPNGNLRWIVVTRDQTNPPTGNYYGYNRTIVDNYNAPNRNPVDIVLALDISGSMSLPVPGSTLNLQKLKLLQQAVEIFIRTWAMHTVPGDQIGVLYFTTNITSLPGGPPALLDVAANADAIVTDMNSKTTQACTAIGGVVQNGYQLLATGANKKVIILFTDGEQTHNPFIDEEGSPAVLKIRQIPASGTLPFDAYWCMGSDSALDPSGNAIVPDGLNLSDHDVQIHTIGVGVDGTSFVELIERISSETDALHHFTSSPDEELDLFFTNDLINSLKTGSLEIVKTQKGTLARGGINSVSVPVNAASTSLTFVVSWNGDLNSEALPVVISAPDGMIVEPVIVSAGNFYKILKYAFPLKRKTKTIPSVGNWSIKLTSQAQTNTLFYQLSAIVDDPCFHYDLDFQKKNYIAGDMIRLAATLTQNGKPLPKTADVLVDVTRPVLSPKNILATYLSKYKKDLAAKLGDIGRPKDLSKDASETDHPLIQAIQALLTMDPKIASQLKMKKISTIHLYDDGKKEHGDLKAADGIYSNLLTATQVAGTYQFHYRVAASTACGLVERSELFSTFIAEGAFDLKQSMVSFQPLPKNEYELIIRPQDKFGNLLGVGKPQAFQILVSQGSLKGAITDNLDGSYKWVLELPPGQDPRIIVLIKGEQFISAPLSVLLKGTGFRRDTTSEVGASVDCPCSITTSR